MLVAPLCARAHLWAHENPYDLLGHTLMPFVTILSESGSSNQRALHLVGKVTDVVGFAPELEGISAEIFLEYPDRLRISAPLLGEKLTICRQGQTIWVYPGSKLKALLAEPKILEKLPEPNRKYQLTPFQLPLPEKELVLLPVLFQAKDGGDDAVDGVICQVLDVKLMSELRRSLKADDWSVRLWIDAEHHPERVLVQKGNSAASIRLSTVEFYGHLPATTWVPEKELEGDVFLVPPARYDQLVRAMLGERR